MSDAKVVAALAMQPPKGASELRSLMGTLNFSRKFCPFFSSITVPLNSLLMLGAVFKWGEREKTTLDTLKTTLAQQIKLYHIDPSFPFRLYTYFSMLGIDALSWCRWITCWK
jgi:hypothetical protein